MEEGGSQGFRCPARLSGMCQALASLSLAALLAAPAAGQGAANSYEHFQLFNACRPMRLYIEELPGSATSIGLSKTALQAAAESRLLAARLYEDGGERISRICTSTSMWAVRQSTSRSSTRRWLAMSSEQKPPQPLGTTGPPAPAGMPATSCQLSRST